MSDETFSKNDWGCAENVIVWCRRCKWTQTTDWSTNPREVYAEHWRECHLHSDGTKRKTD